MPPAKVSTLEDAPSCEVAPLSPDVAAAGGRCSTSISNPTSQNFSLSLGNATSGSANVPPPSQSSDEAINIAHDGTLPPAIKDALGVPAILCEIVDKLPNCAHISLLQSVSRAWRRGCKLALERKFRINDLLAPYFPDVFAFRRLQCELDILISGSFALAMFREYDNRGCRTMGERSDMDLFVDWKLATYLESFLVANGYRLLYSYNNPLPDPDNAQPLASIPDDSFARVVRYKRGDKHVDVVHTTASPVYTIFRFHSTVVMNFITWNRAYSMFPLDTLVKNRGLVLRLNNYRTRLAIRKYASRGFEMIETREAPTNDFDDSLRAGYRWVGDEKCWTVKLNIDNIITAVDRYTGQVDTMAIASDYPYAINGFRLEWAPVAGPTLKPGDVIWCPSQDCDLLTHDSLLYSYAAGHPFHKRLMRYLRRQANIYDSHIDRMLLHVKDDLIRRAEDSNAS